MFSNSVWARLILATVVVCGQAKADDRQLSIDDAIDNLDEDSTKRLEEDIKELKLRGLRSTPEIDFFMSLPTARKMELIRDREASMREVTLVSVALAHASVLSRIQEQQNQEREARELERERERNREAALDRARDVGHDREHMDRHAERDFHDANRANADRRCHMIPADSRSSDLVVADEALDFQ